MNGRLFCLQHSHIKHRLKLDASPHKRAVYSLEYNSKRLVQNRFFSFFLNHIITHLIYTNCIVKNRVECDVIRPCMHVLVL